MTFIDWSDPEEMVGLLAEYVADEAATTRADPARGAFLRALLEGLEGLADASFEAADEIVEALGEVRRSQPIDFAADPVMEHLEACIEELQRIAKQRV